MPFSESGQGFVPSDRREPSEIEIPSSEYAITFVRSSGPGGQNVNKLNTKAELRWSVGASASFSDEEKELIRAAAGNRLNEADELVFHASRERSQKQNKLAVIEKLHALVREALTPEVERISTKPTAGSKARRIEQKQRRGDIKKSRGRVSADDY